MSSPVESLYDGKIYSNVGNRALLQLLPATATKLLDVGCGAGDNARLLGAAGLQVWGATVSEAEGRIARQFCEDVWIGDVESGAIPYGDNFFDVLLMSHVLEHFVRPEAVLAKLARLLKPGGVVVAAVPNMANFRCRWRMAKGDWRRDDDGPFDRTHYQFWSYDSFSQLFVDAKWEILHKDPGETSIPLWPLRRVLPKPAVRGLDRVVGRRFPNLFAGQVLVVARPRRGITPGNSTIPSP